MDYTLHIFRLPAAQEDAVAAELWRMGALGFEVKADERPGFVRLESYFPAGSESVAGEPRNAIDSWTREGVERIDVSAVADQDWMADYRARSRPFAVGRRFWLAPGEPGDPLPEPPDGRLLIRAPAQNAFGTGSHESTRLMLELMEAQRLDGLELLDVGTGSGILTFAALKLGAATVVAYDMDPPSVITASINGGLNRCRGAWLASRADALSAEPAFDMLLVNVLPERVLADYPRLLQTLRPDGRVISSGNLFSRRDELLQRFVSLGLRLEAERREGEWAAFVLVKAGLK